MKLKRQADRFVMGRTKRPTPRSRIKRKPPVGQKIDTILLRIFIALAVFTAGYFAFRFVYMAGKRKGVDPKTNHRQKFVDVLKNQTVEKTYSVNMFFIQPRGRSYVLTPVSTSLKTKVHPLKETLKLLINRRPVDFNAKGLESILYSGIRLRGISVQNGTAILDFNAALGTGAGMQVEARLKQIVYTATQFENIDRVVVLIDGKKRDAISGDGLDISQPLTRHSKYR